MPSIMASDQKMKKGYLGTLYKLAVYEAQSVLIHSTGHRPLLALVLGIFPLVVRTGGGT